MGWNVLYLKPRTEKKLAEYAQGLSLEHYLPLRSETKIYQRRKVTVEKPVFPGYCFVCFDARGRRELLQSNLIVRILEPADETRLLHELDQVRKALAVDPTLNACSALPKGTFVRIRSGPFAGLEGVVAEWRSPIRVLLNVELINRAVAVETDPALLDVLG